MILVICFLGVIHLFLYLSWGMGCDFNPMDSKNFSGFGSYPTFINFPFSQLLLFFVGDIKGLN